MAGYGVERVVPTAAIEQPPQAYGIEYTTMIAARTRQTQRPLVKRALLEGAQTPANVITALIPLPRHIVRGLHPVSVHPLRPCNALTYHLPFWNIKRTNESEQPCSPTTSAMS